jgi:sugar O-acyltransferase (sialic acid O-acetyltransferase NeuD family)
VLLVSAVGTSVLRRKLVQEAKKMGGQFISIIHPTALVSKWEQIGEGAIIQRFCAITSEMKVGKYFACNSLVSIGHDTVIGDYVHINPSVNIAGGSIIGNDVFIGVKATILKAKIGDGAVIGACALITKDVPPKVLAKGIPAKFFEMDKKKY